MDRWRAAGEPDYLPVKDMEAPDTLQSVYTSELMQGPQPVDDQVPARWPQQFSWHPWKLHADVEKKKRPKMFFHLCEIDVVRWVGNDILQQFPNVDGPLKGYAAVVFDAGVPMLLPATIGLAAVQEEVEEARHEIPWGFLYARKLTIKSPGTLRFWHFQKHGGGLLVSQNQQPMTVLIWMCQELTSTQRLELNNGSAPAGFISTTAAEVVTSLGKADKNKTKAEKRKIRRKQRQINAKVQEMQQGIQQKYAMQEVTVQTSGDVKYDNQVHHGSLPDIDDVLCSPEIHKNLTTHVGDDVKYNLLKFEDPPDVKQYKSWRKNECVDIKPMDDIDAGLKGDELSDGDGSEKRTEDTLIAKV